MYHNPLCQKTLITIRSLLVKTRPATEEHNKKGVIYRVPHQDCLKFTLVKRAAIWHKTIWTQTTL